MNPFRQAFLDWPAEISIETFCKCNARCTFCPYPTLDRIDTKMPDEMLDRIIEELKDHPGVFVIAPFKVNEPFLDKRVIPFCKKVNAELPSAHLRLFSNGSTITGKLLGEIASLERVIHYWISLNDHEADSYNATMGLDFDRTAGNLDLLHNWACSGDMPHKVVVSRVRDLSERDQAFIDYVRARWPLFNIHLIKRDSWTGYTESEGGPVPDDICGRWFELNIMADGKVALCCMDGEGEHAIGDLNTQSLFEVYNQREQRQRRLAMISRKCAGGPCDGCNY